MAVDPAPAADEIDRLLGEKNAKLTRIFLTHGHFDHVYSVEELRRRWNCPVWLDPADAKGNELYPMAKSDACYEDGTPIQVDEAEFTPWHTPGHTAGSWIIECAGLLFAGDTLFAGGVGRTDLEGGSPAEQRVSLKKIKGLPLPDDTTVLPGHGDFTTLGQVKDVYKRQSRKLLQQMLCSVCSRWRFASPLDWAPAGCFCSRAAASAASAIWWGWASRPMCRWNGSARLCSGRYPL